MTSAYSAKKLVPLLPVLLVICGLVWQKLQQNAVTASLLGQLLLEYSPFLLAQWYLAQRQWTKVASGFWLSAMVIYPVLSFYFRTTDLQLNPFDWVLMLLFSSLYWLERQLQTRLTDSSRASWPHKLWSLDSAMVLLLTGWVCFIALLLASHQDAWAHQPIPLQFNFHRIAQQPMEFFVYFWQFAVLAGIIFGYYWFNRYLLIRMVLARFGLMAFVLSSLLLLLLSYPLLAHLVLLLPINDANYTTLPSGNHSPFDWDNFKFVFSLWLISSPLILAFDRQQQEKHLAQIQQQQSQTELQLLQQQINPHFLFNTLNNLYALCLTQSVDAPKLILRLADLMRYVVYQGSQPKVSLQQEINYLQDYLALQQLRVSHRTKLEFNFPDQDLPVQLPPLLLIMLVENAFKHGVETTTEASKVQIDIKVKNLQLQFCCENTLPAAASSKTPKGMGLDNLRRRLQLHFGPDFSLSSSPSPLGWKAELYIPLEPLPC